VGKLADKTQLLSLILATWLRKPIPIIAGIFVATLVNHLGAWWIGAWAGHQELELRRHFFARHGVHAFLLEVANARREAKPESPAYRENMVGETAGVGVVLVDDETAFVVEQPIEHMRRLVRARGDDVGMVRSELIRQMGAELYASVLAVVQVVAIAEAATRPDSSGAR
jgi:putative Ca2+/H+ antiporter (TMEM165/GDT1 family)